MTLFRASLAVAMLPLAGCAAQPLPAETAPAEAAAVRLDPLAIETARGVRRFMVEVAVTPEEQAQGLMFRPVLPEGRGMIFPFATPRRAAFWMKDTPSPLDLLFIRADGSVARIAAMAVPHSLDLIDAGEPVAAVLEIAGGSAARLGIRPGDRVRWAGLATGS